MVGEKPQELIPTRRRHHHSDDAPRTTKPHRPTGTAGNYLHELDGIAAKANAGRRNELGTFIPQRHRLLHHTDATII